MTESDAKQVVRGTDLHNSIINKTGVVLDASNTKAVKVMTVDGKQEWAIKDCEIIQPDI